MRDLSFSPIMLMASWPTDAYLSSGYVEPRRFSIIDMGQSEAIYDLIMRYVKPAGIKHVY